MRFALIPLLLLAVASAPACQTSKGTVPTTPPTGMNTRPAEYAVLDSFLGKWSGTTTMTKATGMFAEEMPKGEGGKLPTYEGGASTTWTLGNHYVMSEGWYETGKDQKNSYVEYITWVPSEKKYHTTSFCSDGSTSDGWMKADGNTFTMTSTGTMHGMKTKGTGKMTFTTPNTMEWTWSMETDKGTMEMRGTSKRK